MRFVGGQGRFETRRRGTFDGRHTSQASGEVSEKGWAMRPAPTLVFPGRREYRIFVRAGVPFWKRP
jgi:hypothetical protein